MFFLEGDEEGPSSCPLPSQLEQEFFMQPPTPSSGASHRGQEDGKKLVESSAAHKREIQERVDKAIRNSIKLINGLKAKDA